MDERGEKPAYDETAALKELERFREEIDRQRARRKAAGDEFDQFIRSFKSPADLFPSESQAHDGQGTPAASAVPTSGAAPVAAPELAAAPPAVPAPGPSSPGRLARHATAGSTAVDAIAERSAAVPTPSQVKPAPDQVRKRRPLMLGGALILTVVAVAAIWSLRSDGPQSPSSETAPVRGEAAPVQTPAAPSSATPPVQETVLTTIRRAWVRVIADGERIVERELPANTRVPLPDAKTIVIRTGDAGAVRLTIAGQDQGPLGGNGQVVTRTFTGGAPDRR
jgi:hypothetical protein